MPGFRVHVTGRKPAAEDKLPALPSIPYSFALAPQPAYETVELQFPAICPCCGEAVEPGDHLVVGKVKGRGGFTSTTLENWHVPYCSTCLRHIALKQQRPTLSVVIEIVMIITALIAVFSLLKSNAVVAAMAFIGIIIAGLVLNAWVLRRYEKTEVRPMMKDTCNAPGAALTYLGWNDDRTRHTFLFVSEKYAREFAKANHSEDIFRVK